MKNTDYLGAGPKDLGSIVYRIANQWKAILLCMIILMLIATGAKHMRDVQAQKAAFKAKETASEQQTGIGSEKEILNALSSSERIGVINYVKQVEWLEKEEDYAMNSILMNTDPNNQRIAVFNYIVSLPEGRDDYQRANLLLRSFINSTTFAKDIKDAINSEAKDCFITELNVFYEDRYKENKTFTASDLYQFGIIITDSVDIDTLSEAVNNSLLGYVRENRTMIANARLFKVEEQRFINSSAVATKQNMTNTIRDTMNSINNVKSSLTEKQISAANAILSLHSLSSEVSPESPSESMDTQTVSVGYSKKYALAGAFLGFIIYLICFFIIENVKGRVNAYENIDNMLGGTRLIGKICTKSNKNSFLFSSKAVNALCRKRESSEEDFKHIIQSLIATSRYYKMEYVALMSASLLTEPFATRIVDYLNAEGIGSKVINAYDESGHVKESEILDTDNAVLLVHESDRKDHIEKLASLMKSFNKELTGTIFIQEI